MQLYTLHKSIWRGFKKFDVEYFYTLVCCISMAFHFFMPCPANMVIALHLAALLPLLLPLGLFTFRLHRLRGRVYLVTKN